MNIDPADRAAPWEQLATILRDRITSGYYQPGKKIDSITELQDESGLSQNTVKRAIGKLKEEGLLEGVQGRGVFVVGRRPRGSVRSA